MTSRRDEAIVLARAPLRERDLLVVLLTRQEGLQRAVARRARGGTRGRVGAVLEPLNRCRVSLFQRAGAELATLDEAALVRSSFVLARSPAAWAAGQVVAELATLFCPEGQRREASFRLVDRCLEHLLGEGDPRIVVAYAELWLLRLSGVLPDLARCAGCGRSLGAGPWGWDAAAGHLFCSDHASRGSPKLLPAAAATWVAQASRVSLERLGIAPPPAAAAWLRGLSEGFTERELRSRAFFEQALAAVQPGRRGADGPRSSPDS